MKKIAITILLLIFPLVTYFMTSSGTTPYDYFTRLADAFLNNKYYLQDSPAWLNELIPIGDNKYAIVYPPAPAIISMPLRYFFGHLFEQQYLAHLFGALFALIIAKTAFKITKKVNIFIWFYLLAGFGNIIWFLASNGSVWYLGQVSGALFLSAAIYESVSKKRLLLISIFMGMAVLSRLQTILAIPLIAYLNWKDIKNFINFIKLTFPFFIILSLYAIYNFIRFGSFIETGYSLIPGVLNEPWYSHGIFHFSYITNNLKVMFLSLPIFKNEFPYITPSWGGLSILITTPAFIYVILTKLKDRSNQFTLLSLVLIALVTFSHGGTGFTQFGYRYAVDFYPILFFILINRIKVTNLSWHHWVLLIFSIIVNLWGVLWINKFGWVSF